MALRLDIELTESQRQAMARIPATSWFTQVIYRNAQSAIHPDRQLAANNEMKQKMVADWISKTVPGKKVLDLFAANGAFSVLAALAGAREVVGLEYSEERIRCAEFVASTVNSTGPISFRRGDVYKVLEYFDEPFDVVLCLGGLYHVADPALVLRQIGKITKETLIVQTSQVLRRPGNWAKFEVRRQDRTSEGLTSIRKGYGTWYYTRRCLQELLLHGQFRVVEERQPPWLKHRRFPWYLARCEPVPG